MEELLKTPITWAHSIVCLFLVGIVLLQPGKSGGLGGLTGAGATQVFGGRGATHILAKLSWVAATVFFLTSTALGYFSSANDDTLQDLAAKEAAETKKLDLPAVEPKLPVEGLPVDPEGALPSASAAAELASAAPSTLPEGALPGAAPSAATAPVTSAAKPAAPKTPASAAPKAPSTPRPAPAPSAP